MSFQTQASCEKGSKYRFNPAARRYCSHCADFRAEQHLGFEEDDCSEFQEGTTPPPLDAREEFAAAGVAEQENPAHCCPAANVVASLHEKVDELDGAITEHQELQDMALDLEHARARQEEVWRAENQQLQDRLAKLEMLSSAREEHHLGGAVLPEI